MRTLMLFVCLFLCHVPFNIWAFCGFYVGGNDAKLYNDATQVALMRMGTKTVLSMQNTYQGPPEDFAMVVPVPQVLEKANIKTLNAGVFERLDALASPKLVKYEERDPCVERIYDKRRMDSAPMASGRGFGSGGSVEVRAQFEVGEYDISILEARDSGALEEWLLKHDYKVPKGAAPYYEPYIQSGMYFFVAKVNIQRVNIDPEGNALLSPLRFHYDSPDFQLPIRLGMINSKGEQDLIVHIIAPGQRYEVANYPNRFIPTNYEAPSNTEGQFAAYYERIFKKYAGKTKPNAVTEFAWTIGSGDEPKCDPCPPRDMRLTRSDLSSLGADLIGYHDFVLTRIHMRYKQGKIGEDLVFRTAPPVRGGNESYDANDKLSHEAIASGLNRFQARYAIRKRWRGKIKCPSPHRGQWGAPTVNLERSGKK